MSSRKLIAIPCKLSPGMFSSELVFTVTMADGHHYQGIAPRHFCWNSQDELVAEGEVTEEVDGKVAAKIVEEELEGAQVAVEVPDAEVIAVPTEEILKRPTEIKPSHYSTPTEPSPNVPV